MRIRLADLEFLVERINIITGNNTESYTKDENGKYTANIGNYYLSGAYGG